MKNYTPKEIIKKALGKPVRYAQPDIFIDHPLNTFPIKTEGDSWKNFLKTVDEFGIIHPILVDSNNRIISGKRRRVAAKEKNIHVPYFRLPNHKIDKNKLEAIILICNITSRSLERETIDEMWNKVYGLFTVKELEKGSTPYQITKKISNDSGLNMRTIRRHVYRFQNALILEKFKTIDNIKTAQPSRLKTLIQKADELLSEAIDKVKQYQDNRREISAIVRPALVGVNEVVIQQKNEDVISAVTGVPEVSIRGANFVSRPKKLLRRK